MGEKGAKATGAGAAAAAELLDDLQPLGNVTSKKMFGGHGVFLDDVMFALIDSAGRCFLWANETTAVPFAAAGSDRHGRMPYWEIPPAVRSDTDVLLDWARTAAAAAYAKKRKPGGPMDDPVAVNRAHWEAITPGHVTSAFYDVPSFLEGRSTVDDVEEDAVGPVAGKTLLHLQCHFGMDTISWARRGAIATGVDFALPAIEAARDLAARAGVEARFVHSDVYRLPEVLDEEFDVVFTSHGVLGWLPDLRRWADVVARYTAPGGRFVLLDSHPVLWVFDDERTDGSMTLRYPYFSKEPVVFDQEGSYADPAGPLTRTMEYIHPIEDVLTALIEAGLRIEAFREYDKVAWQALPHMVRGDDGWWRLPPGAVTIPLMFSVVAARDT